MEEVEIVDETNQPSEKPAEEGARDSPVDEMVEEIEWWIYKEARKVLEDDF